MTFYITTLFLGNIWCLSFLLKSLLLFIGSYFSMLLHNADEWPIHNCKDQLPRKSFLSNIMASDIGKEQWKILCKKAVASYWTRLYRDDIKNKKTLKYLSVRGLRVGHSHLVWQDLSGQCQQSEKELSKQVFSPESICFSRKDTYLATRLLTQIVDYVNWRWRILVMSSLDVQHTMWYEQLLQNSLRRSS